MATKILKLEVIQNINKKTGRENGVFIHVWRNWDSKYNIDPQMVYFNKIESGYQIVPHLHKEITGYVTCLTGRVSLVLKRDNNYEKIICDANNPSTVEILPGVGLLIINIGNITASLINICSPAWHPDNQDSFTVDFSDINESI